MPEHNGSTQTSLPEQYTCYSRRGDVRKVMFKLWHLRVT
jgi:hypothetical protein